MSSGKSIHFFSSPLGNEIELQVGRNGARRGAELYFYKGYGGERESLLQCQKSNDSFRSLRMTVTHLVTSVCWRSCGYGGLHGQNGLCLTELPDSFGGGVRPVLQGSLKRWLKD